MKENSNMFYAMLQQPDKYQPPLTQLLEKLLTFQHPSGAFFSYYDIKKKQVIKDHFDKTQNFTIIDLLTDLATKFKKPQGLHSSKRTNIDASPGVNRKTLIDSATNCADFWISHQHKKTHLIPDYFLPSGKTKYSIAKLDQSADLYSSFLRLYTLTKNNKYLNAAQTGAQVLQKYFGSSSWWHRIVNIKTGQPAKDSQAPPLRPPRRQKPHQIRRRRSSFLSLVIRSKIRFTLRSFSEGGQVHAKRQSPPASLPR